MKEKESDIRRWPVCEGVREINIGKNVGEKVGTGVEKKNDERASIYPILFCAVLLFTPVSPCKNFPEI